MVVITLDNGRQIYLDAALMYALDTMVYNVKKDWDFVIVITGNRMVRVGKSVLGMSISAYLAYRLKTPFGNENIFFDSATMIDKAQKMPQHSIIQYDEGREGLAASKSMQKVSQDLVDFFNECGQLNHIFVIVLPDFFSLKEEIAVGRSECLINVYRHEENLMSDIYHDGTERPVVRFDRGYFTFYNRYKKQELFDKARSTKRKSYHLVKPNFRGRFTNNYPLDEELYRQQKRDALARFKERKTQEKALDQRAKNNNKVLMEIAWGLHKEGHDGPTIAKMIEEKYNAPISKWGINTLIRLKKAEIGGGPESEV